MSRRKWFAAVGVVLLTVLDQLTKYLAYVRLRPVGEYALIPEIFTLRYHENESAAFGIDPISILHRIFHITYFTEHPGAFLRSKMIFFVVLTLIAGIVLVLIYRRIPETRRFAPLRVALIFFLAGAIGNLIDRVVHSYVIDFFYFRLIDFPIFNVADIYVTTAAFALAFLLFFFYKEDDFAQLPHY